MKFTRGAEEEADKLGVQYMYAAGYDPGAMATMFEKLEAKNKKKPGFIARAFSLRTRRPPDRRAASLALAARFPEHEEYVISLQSFSALNRACCDFQMLAQQRPERLQRSARGVLPDGRR